MFWEPCHSFATSTENLDNGLKPRSKKDRFNIKRIDRNVPENEWMSKKLKAEKHKNQREIKFNRRNPDNWPSGKALKFNGTNSGALFRL